MTFSTLAPLAATLTSALFTSAPQESASAEFVDVATFGAENPFRPRLALEGTTRTGGPFSLTVRNAGLNNLGLVAYSTAFQPVFVPALASTLVPGAPLVLEAFTTFGLDAEGLLAVPSLPAALAGQELVAQAAVFSPLAPGNFLVTDAQRYRFGTAFLIEQVVDGFSRELTPGLTARLTDFVGGPEPDLGILTLGSISLFEDVSAEGGPSPVSAFLVVPSGTTDFEVIDAGNLLPIPSRPDAVIWTDRASSAQVISGEPFAGFDILDVNGAIRAVRVVDVDLDGDQDVAIVSTAPDELTLFRQDGDFQFTALAPLALVQSGTPQPDDAVLFATALVDGNALPDFVVGLGRGDVQVVAGAGAVAPTTVIDTRALSSPGDEAALALGDLDGSGGLDAAIAIGSGPGGFELLFDLAGATPPASLAVSAPDALDGVAIADVDGDGDADLIGARAGADGIVDGYLLRREGSGLVFAAAEPLVVNGALDRFALADGDGDGLPELFGFALELGLLTTLPGRASGFPAPVATATAAGVDDLRLADADGDGTVDALVRSRNTGDVWLQRGNGDGSFQAPTLVASTPPSAFWAVADLDGDGDLDLATLAEPPAVLVQAVRIFSNDGAGNFGQVNVQQSTTVSGEPVALLALDASPTVDAALTPLVEGAQGIAVVSRTGLAGQYTVRLFRSTTDDLDPLVALPFVATTSPVFSLGSDVGVGVASLDVDADGVDELIVTSAGAAADGHLVRGQQTPTAYVLSTEPLGLDGSIPGVVDGADLDLDGVASGVVLRDRVDGQVRAQRFLDGPGGDGVATSPFGAIAASGVVVTGRFDAGDLVDLAVLLPEGLVDVAQGGGTVGVETFLSRRAALLGTDLIAIAAADLDGDGRDELVAISATEGRTLVVAPKLD